MALCNCSTLAKQILELLKASIVEDIRVTRYRRAISPVLRVRECDVASNTSLIPSISLNNGDDVCDHLSLLVANLPSAFESTMESSFERLMK